MSDQTIKLLVIDDEPIVGKRLKQAFMKMGMEVETFTDPREAMNTIKQKSFDIVVTDLKMEGMDGMTILEEVQKLNPKAKVIIITGYAQVDTASEAFRKGVFDFIPKPFRLEELKNIILRAMSGALSESNKNI
ncbi:MAG: response regulator [Deltaproteobacteria bacterium]|nr:response regulator [Deltaproteobacteria bacterium]